MRVYALSNLFIWRDKVGEIMGIELRGKNGAIDLKVPIKQVGGGAVDSVNGMTGDVVLTANDVGAIDKYNGMTPVECVYTHFGSQQTKIIYVEEGTLIPPSSSASDDIKNAWKRLLAIPLSGLAATGPNSSFKDLIRGIGLLADNGVFGDLLSQSGNEFICYTDIFKQEVCLHIYNSKADDKTITVYFNYYKQDKYQQVIYCISTDTFDDYCSFDEPVKKYSNNINTTTLTMPQAEMAAAPTKDMHIATKKYVDDSVSNPLNITGATVGQIAKITAVDDSGKPTTWEAVDMAGGESSFPKFEKLLTHTITEEEIAANPIAFVWGTGQIPNLNDFNVFTLTIRNPDDTTKITFTKWVRLKINNVLMGNICGTSQGEGYKYSISANRLYGFWVSDNMYNPNNDDTNVLTPPYSRHGFDSNLAASEAVTSIGFTSYNTDYGLTAGIVVEIWGAK